MENVEPVTVGQLLNQLAQLPPDAILVNGNPMNRMSGECIISTIKIHRYDVTTTDNQEFVAVHIQLHNNNFPKFIKPAGYTG